MAVVAVRCLCGLLATFAFMLLAVVKFSDAASDSRASRISTGRHFEPRVFRHHNHTPLERVLRKYARRYSSISRLYSIGRSVNRRNLWVMEISDNPGRHEPGEPEFKYIGTIHGNEVVGREMLVLLVQYLLRNYGHDERVTRLVNTTRIHILPAINPDGYETARPGDVSSTRGRKNAHRVDLNRNFPSVFRQPRRGPEPETQALMSWIDMYPFVLSAGLHGGALVANYPYDDSLSGRRKYSRCPDDDIFRQVSLVYSKAHRRMHMFSHCPGDRDHFKDGITNGAAWYPIVGGMQDYNYHYTSCFEVTLELSCTKFPRKKHLRGFWNENKPALMAFMEEVHRGVKGFVRDHGGNPISNAAITVAGRNHDVFSAAEGDYWRLLVPGRYQIIASKAGYIAQMQDVRVPQTGAVEVNFVLS